MERTFVPIITYYLFACTCDNFEKLSVIIPKKIKNFIYLYQSENKNVAFNFEF